MSKLIPRVLVLDPRSSAFFPFCRRDPALARPPLAWPLMLLHAHVMVTSSIASLRAAAAGSYARNASSLNEPRSLKRRDAGYKQSRPPGTAALALEAAPRGRPP